MVAHGEVGQTSLFDGGGAGGGVLEPGTWEGMRVGAGLGT